MNARTAQIVFITCTLAVSWLAFQVVHEAGHVAHLWLSGGEVAYVVLHPLRLSHTMPGVNPRPLFVAIGGPLWGCILPLGLWAVVRMALPGRAFLARFFAATCLVANGVYLAADAFLQGGDGRELVRGGLSPWLLVAIGVALAAVGLVLWNGEGKHFGLGPRAKAVHWSDALIMSSLLAAILSVEILFGRPATAGWATG